MSAEPPTDPDNSDDSGGSTPNPDAESEQNREDTAGGDERRDDARGADGEVSRAFVLGLLAIGLLLFSLFAWAALTGRGSPL